MEIRNINPQIKQFIHNQLLILSQQYQDLFNPQRKLKIACKIQSFAQILKLYFQDESWMSQGLLKQAQSYLELNSHQEALARARLAKRYLQVSKKQKKQEAQLLIVKCLLRNKQIEDAEDVLLNIKEKTEAHEIECLMLRLQILAHKKEDHLVKEVLQNLEEKAIKIYDINSVEYGEHLIEKGEKLQLLEMYEEASKQLRSGLNIFIKNRNKDKKKVAKIYEHLAACSKKLDDLENELTSLMCGQSMVRQVEGEEKLHICFMHKIVENMLKRESYGQALNWLLKVREKEKLIYGEYSQKIGKTTKSICLVLTSLDRKTQAKKYQQQYQKILGTCSTIIDNSQQLHPRSRKLQVINLNK